METAVIMLLIVGVMFYAAGKQLKNTAKLKELGFEMGNKIDVGKYVAGHPDIDKASEKMSIVKKGNYLELIPFVIGKDFNFPKIGMSEIKNISVEDKSVLEKRVTATRLLLTGVFALAWKKNTKEEFAYLVIEWNDGRFGHETIFEYSKKGAFEKANTARNQIMRMIR